MFKYPFKNHLQCNTGIHKIFSKNRPSGPILSISRNVRMCVCLCVCVSQLFQATATVAISWWASSFLREDTVDKSSRMEQKVSPRDKFSNFNTNGMFLTHLGLQDFQKWFLGFRMIWNFFLVCPRCTVYLYSLTRSSFLLSRLFCQLTLAPSVDRILNFSLSLLAFRQSQQKLV